jgi:hypothetical protein
MFIYLQEAADEDAEANGADEEEERFDLIEFAENYFNDHEKSPTGTIVGTLKRGAGAGSGSGKGADMLPKKEMVSYYKGTSIPNSHIHMFDPENVNIACNIFKVCLKLFDSDKSFENYE